MKKNLATPRKPGDVAYYMPCKPGSAYVNVTDACQNECLFCIKRDGPHFFGWDLSLDGRSPEPGEILEALEALPGCNAINEIVFCGMGEPLLRYQCVVDACGAIRRQMGSGIEIRVDTSGLFWASTERLDILDCVDVLSISLNAETADKYEELCRPKIERAYEILFEFLRALKLSMVHRRRRGLVNPNVLLSVVDTSEEEFIPQSGREAYARGSFPVPDIEACREIAVGFGWPLVVKRLFRDSRKEIWRDPVLRELCSRGVALDICRGCPHRH